jgi:hypothetical protein
MLVGQSQSPQPPFSLLRHPEVPRFHQRGEGSRVRRLDTRIELPVEDSNLLSI